MASLLAACWLSSVQAVLLDFNGATSTTTFPFSEDGFNVTATGTANFAGCSPPCANNGTTNIFINGGTVDISSAPPSLFSLLAFEGGELFQGLPATWSTDIVVTGFLFGGGTVTSHFFLDGIHDGPGGLVDVQVFSLPGTFTGLTHATFASAAGGGFTLDNVNVVPSVVPEPATLALLGIGLAGLGFSRRKEWTTSMQLTD